MSTQFDQKIAASEQRQEQSFVALAKRIENWSSNSQCQENSKNWKSSPSNHNLCMQLMITPPATQLKQKSTPHQLFLMEIQTHIQTHNIYLQSTY